MAPSVAPLMTPSSSITRGNKRPPRIIPAIPRSLERNTKKAIFTSTDGRGSGIQFVGDKTEPSAPDQSLENEASNGQENSQELEEMVQRAVTPEIDDVCSVLEPGSTEKTVLTENSKTSSPETTRDFGIEKHGFKLPPPFCPKASPPAAISTDFPISSDPSEPVTESSQTPDGFDNNESGTSPTVIGALPIRSAVPNLHAHSTLPADITGSPADSSNQSHVVNHSISFHPKSASPPDTEMSPLRLSHQVQHPGQSISFFAEQTQSSQDPSSPSRSTYQGYSYGPTSHGYSPQSYVSRRPEDSPRHAGFGVPYGQHFDSQSSYYGQPSVYAVRSHPPLTPSATPLDPRVQQWSFPSGPQLPMPFENGYHPTADSRFRYRSISQGTLKSDDSVSRNVELDDESPHAACMNGYGPGHEQISMFNTFQSTSKDALSTQVQLAGHILHHFNVEEFADCRLFLVHENHRFADTQWLLSSLVLAQSPILRHLLRTSEPARDGKKRLSLKVADRFNAPGGMESGLRVLYGQPAESFTGFGNHIGLEAEAQRSKRLMDEALAFAAAGEVLGIESVVERGLRTASTVLNWDNLERALSFGLERQIHHKYNPSSAETPAYYEVSLHESDSSPSNTIFTPPTSSKESRVEQSNPPGLGVAEFAEYPKKERSFWDLEMRCVGFLVENVGDSWEFDPSARPLADVDRLPVTMESQSPLSKSRLSRIQFGDHPSEMHAKSSDRNNLISSILLSLPFKTLRLMVTSIAPSIVRHVHSIVKERERRRHIVLQSKSVPWAYRLAAREHEWAEVGFTEWVASSHDGEVSLRRRFTGIDRQVTEPSTPK